MKTFLKITISIFIIFIISCSKSGNIPDFKQTTTKKDDQPPSSSHIQKFNNLVQQLREFTKKIPKEDQSYFAGYTYNTFLSETSDPNSDISPMPDPPQPSKYFGIGTRIMKYHSDNEDLNGLLMISPFKGSPAQIADIKSGDLIKSVDGVNVKDLPIENIVKQITGTQGTKVTLGVLGFCDNQEKEISVTRGPIIPPFHWHEESRFVNVDKEETFKHCETQGSEDPETESSNSKNPSSILGFQALYVPLKTFKNDDPSQHGKLCNEFIELQLKDIKNPSSIGMIIDLRGNTGGSLYEVSCMLNTLIQSNDVIVRQLPIKEGKLLTQTTRTSFYFTKGGFIPANDSSFLSYNKNIVVLVDNISASASEIFAGTIQDMKYGWVVGNRTFGKGTIQSSSSETLPGYKRPINKSLTIGIYTLNSERSPQGYGIIPDFHFSRTGEPIQEQSDYVSFMDKRFFNNIQFENNVWKQNRPDELAQMSECVHKAGMLGRTLKENSKSDERYTRNLFVTDYQLELAKDILFCSPVVESTLRWPSVIPVKTVR